MNKSKLQRLEQAIAEAELLKGGGTRNLPLEDEVREHLEAYVTSLKAAASGEREQLKHEIIHSFREIIRVREQVREGGLSTVDDIAKRHLETLVGGELPSIVFSRQKIFEEVVDKAVADTAEIFEGEVLQEIVTEGEGLRRALDQQCKELEELRAELTAIQSQQESSEASGIADSLAAISSPIERFVYLVSTRPVTLIAFSIGLFAASSSIKDAITILLRSSVMKLSDIGDLFVAPAFAADVNNNTEATESIQIAGLEIVHIIILCLVICYIASIAGVFFLRQKSKIDFCIDSIKGLTGFFIGVATGFFNAK